MSGTKLLILPFGSEKAKKKKKIKIHKVFSFLSPFPKRGAMVKCWDWMDNYEKLNFLFSPSNTNKQKICQLEKKIKKTHFSTSLRKEDLENLSTVIQMTTCNQKIIWTEVKFRTVQSWHKTKEM